MSCTCSSFQSSFTQCELYLVFLLVVFNLRKNFAFVPALCQDVQNETFCVGQSLYLEDVDFWESIIVNDKYHCKRSDFPPKMGLSTPLGCPVSVRITGILQCWRGNLSFSVTLEVG